MTNYRSIKRDERIYKLLYQHDVNDFSDAYGRLSDDKRFGHTEFEKSLDDKRTLRQRSDSDNDRNSGESLVDSLDEFDFGEDE